MCMALRCILQALSLHGRQHLHALASPPRLSVAVLMLIIQLKADSKLQQLARHSAS